MKYLRGALVMGALMATVPLRAGGEAGAPSRVEADRLFMAGDYQGAARAYKALLDARDGESQPNDTEPGDLVGPGPGVVEPRLKQLGALPRGLTRGAAPVALALISETGAVLEARLVSHSGTREIDEAVVKAVKGASFEPARRHGVPVKMWYSVRIPVGER